MGCKILQCEKYTRRQVGKKDHFGQISLGFCLSVYFYPRCSHPDPELSSYTDPTSFIKPHVLRPLLRVSTHHSPPLAVAGIGERTQWWGEHVKGCGRVAASLNTVLRCDWIGRNLLHFAQVGLGLKKGLLWGGNMASRVSNLRKSRIINIRGEKYQQNQFRTQLRLKNRSL